MEILRKYNTATHIYIPIVKRNAVDFAVSADWTPAAGDVKISKDGAAAGNVTNLPTAITMGNGAMWDFSLTNTEMSAAKIVITVVDAATKAVEDQAITIATYGNASAEYQMDLTDSVRLGLTALPNAAAGANGGLPTGDANAAVKVQTGSGTGQLDFTSGVVKSNVTQIDGVANGTHASGMIPADVRDFGGSAGTFSGGRPEVIAQAKDSFVVRNATAQAGASTSITLDASASSTTDFYKGTHVKIDSGTGAGQTRTITASDGSTKVATVSRAWATNPDNTSVFTIITFDGATLDSSLRVTAGTVSDKSGYSLTQTFPTNFATMVIDGSGRIDLSKWAGVAVNALISGRVDANAQVVGDKSGYSLSQAFPTNFSSLSIDGFGRVDIGKWVGVAPNALVQGKVDAATIIRSATAQAGAAGTITLDGSASATTDFYKDCWILIVSATGVGQVRLCSAYNGGTKVATIKPNWVTNPDGTSVFMILPAGAISNVTLTDTVTTLTNAPSDSSGVTTLLSRIASALTITGGKVDVNDKTGFSLSSAGVQAVWDFLLSGIAVASSIGKLIKDNLDAAISSRLPTSSYTTPPTAAAIADQVWDETMSDHLTAGTTGAKLNSAGGGSDPWSTALPGAYGAGTAGKIIGDNLNAAISSRLATASYTAPDNASVAAIKTQTDKLNFTGVDVKATLDGETVTPAAGSIAAATLAADTSTYQCKIGLIEDGTSGTDIYTVAWFKDGQPIIAGITSPMLQVIKTADGTDLIASTALTQIGATGMYRLNETTNRAVDGAAYIAHAQAMIDGSTRSWNSPVGRDA